VHWTKSVQVVGEDPTVSPAENGVVLIFSVTLAHAPITNDDVVVTWLESGIAKTATVSYTNVVKGANAANVSTVLLDRSTGDLDIIFAAGHAPDANSIRASYSYIGSAASVSDSAGRFSASGVVGTINYHTGDLSLTFTGAAVVPYNGSTVTVDYSGEQGWSRGIRITSSVGGYVEFSFDGTNVHGRIDNGSVFEYLDRYEAGIALRGSGTFVLEAW
jgi:hypothetical protein